MRSRYAAFALGENDYLLDTWHPDYRPQSLGDDQALRWIGLEIVDCELGSERARVEFEARYLAAGRVDAVHERSDFLRVNGRWFYTVGQQLPPTRDAWKPARNETCPCGSGAKFKRCCGRA